MCKSRRASVARVLIADDDTQYLAAFSDAMVALGHEVSGTRTRAETLETLRRGSYDIVFLDVLMPGGGAISLIHEVRDEDADIPIIVITGHHTVFQSPIVSEGLRLAQARIPKTTPLVELASLVENLVRQP